jgi:hypothetical protein
MMSDNLAFKDEEELEEFLLRIGNDENMRIVSNVHKGHPIYVIGGGSSLEGFDFSKLENKITIGCNKAAFQANTKYAAFFDKPFLRKYRQELEEFNGLVFTRADRYIRLSRGNIIYCRIWIGDKNQMKSLRKSKPLPLGVSERFEDGVSTGGNCGFFALTLAYLLGGNPIYLLGMDMKFGEGKRKYFYEGKDEAGGEDQYKHMRQAFEYGAKVFERWGIKVYNCSSISKLVNYEKISLDTI